MNAHTQSSMMVGREPSGIKRQEDVYTLLIRALSVLGPEKVDQRTLTELEAVVRGANATLKTFSYDSTEPYKGTSQVYDVLLTRYFSSQGSGSRRKSNLTTSEWGEFADAPLGDFTGLVLTDLKNNTDKDIYAMFGTLKAEHALRSFEPRFSDVIEPLERILICYRDILGDGGEKFKKAITETRKIVRQIARQTPTYKFPETTSIPIYLATS